ncbi:MAG: 5-formyltetrahydrofolate cyclo-ligase [Bacteroidota bacterium]
MTETDGYLSEVMDLFMSRYSPCETIDGATHFLSTVEIHRAIQELNPGAKVKKEAIYKLMRQSGYRFMIEDQKFSFSLKWMLTAQ